MGLQINFILMQSKNLLDVQLGFPFKCSANGCLVDWIETEDGK